MHESDQNPAPGPGAAFPEGQPTDTFYAHKIAQLEGLRLLLDAQAHGEAVEKATWLARDGYLRLADWAECIPIESMIELCDSWGERALEIDEIHPDDPIATHYGRLTKLALYGSVSLAHQYLPPIPQRERFAYVDSNDKRESSSGELFASIIEDLKTMNADELARFAQNTWKGMLDTHPDAHILFYAWASYYEEIMRSSLDPGKTIAIEAAIVLPYMLSATSENLNNFLPHVEPSQVRFMLSEDEQLAQLLEKYPRPPKG